ncbi:hypothetical protein GY45DRAFT_377528 [Cubamyces sp. BRFM 1775]|nr:hypothetical protein GY45DRAFT_377528 [Cubamyces sp. BRFM 1775]
MAMAMAMTMARRAWKDASATGHSQQPNSARWSPRARRLRIARRASRQLQQRPVARRPSPVARLSSIFPFLSRATQPPSLLCSALPPRTARTAQYVALRVRIHPSIHSSIRRLPLRPTPHPPPTSFSARSRSLRPRNPLPLSPLSLNAAPKNVKAPKHPNSPIAQSPNHPVAPIYELPYPRASDSPTVRTPSRHPHPKTHIIPKPQSRPKSKSKSKPEQPAASHFFPAPLRHPYPYPYPYLFVPLGFVVTDVRHPGF